MAKGKKSEAKNRQRKLKKHKLQIYNEIRGVLREKMKTDSTENIYEVVLQSGRDTPSNGFQRGSYSVLWTKDVLPSFSRHYSGPYTEGAIFHLLAVIDALKACPKDKALVLALSEKTLFKFVNGGIKLTGIFEKYKDILKPYIDTIEMQLKSKELPVRARLYTKEENRKDVNVAATKIRQVLPLDNTALPITTPLTSAGFPSAVAISRPLPLPSDYPPTTNMVNGGGISGIWNFLTTLVTTAQESRDSDAESESSKDDEEEEYMTSKQRQQDEEDIDRWICENDERPLKRRRMVVDQSGAQQKEISNESLVGRV
ncbi:hypothetical protein BDB00DRAFT_799721 [Zychaea mexicana]|uniref:uncharacterized protein n=1 Tax=Zychaea mexicana TaxID=64656 RepID=UPI0022FE3CEC|nr:uncharacterized protein BDB00DRAFT_799721 [Zychaea mexicana]KAI9498292.1 hypothetical protein BDB00DRAFT_799721 [Zychaea mexicana]